MDRRAVAWKDQGNTCYKERRFQEALGCYAEAIRIDPGYADAWHNLGMTCRALGYEEEARSCFSKEQYYKDPAISPGPDARPPGNFFAAEPGLAGKRRNNGNQKPRNITKTSWKAGIAIFSIIFLVLAAVLLVIPTISGTQSYSAVIPDIPGTQSSGNGIASTGTLPVPMNTPAGVVLKSTPLQDVTGQVPVRYQALKTGAVSRSFPYVMRGEPGTIDLILYKGVNDETGKADPYCYVGKEDRYQKFIDLPVQGQFLLPLVDAIRSKTSDPDDQVRIAVSLVQKIPYDEDVINSDSLEIRYPYQTLFDNKGVCCEKSVLLAYILRELGYGTVLFDFPEEQHTAVGIKVVTQYSYKNTGYAFIETTTPSIISNGNGDYPGFGRIQSAPEVLPVAAGRSFDSIKEEWEDSAEWDRIDALGPVLDKYDFHQWQALCKKYGIVPGS
jgi:TPR repeat